MPCSYYGGDVVIEYYPDSDDPSQARQRGISHAQPQVSHEETRRLKEQTAALAKLSRKEERLLAKLSAEILAKIPETAEDRQIMRILKNYREVI